MANPQANHSDIEHLFGPVNDHVAREILDLEPSIGELEIAAAYVAGMTDVMGEVRTPLSGNAARIYDIVSRDESMLEEEEARRA